MNSSTEKQSLEILRGDIIMADLGHGLGSEYQGIRPCLVIQNNMGNKYSTTVTVIPFTSFISKRKMPIHVKIEEGQFGLTKTSTICAEALRTIDKQRFIEKTGEVDENTMVKVENAVSIHLGFLKNSNE